jgi:hypothetical protein
MPKLSDAEWNRLRYMIEREDESVWKTINASAASFARWVHVAAPWIWEKIKDCLDWVFELVSSWF